MRASGIELQAGGVGKTTHEAPAAEAVAHQDGQLVLAGLQRPSARLVVADQSLVGARRSGSSGRRSRAAGRSGTR